MQKFINFAQEIKAGNDALNLQKVVCSISESLNYNVTIFVTHNYVLTF